MTTPTTPYDEELFGLYINPRFSDSEWRKARDQAEAAQQGYRQALADVQPRIDALEKRLRDAAGAFARLDVIMQKTEFWEHGFGVAPILQRIRAALKLAEKE